MQKTGDLAADMRALIAAYEAEGHSVFRPSSASRWMTCAGSVLAEIQAKADSAGFEAAQGTVAHAISEHRMKKGKLPKWAVPGRTRQERGFIIPITEEMLSYVEQYAEWCDELGSGDVVAAETRVDFSDLTPIPNQGGTADHIHIADGTLTITDLKYGTGVRVYAKGNKQARLYAYGAYRMWRDQYRVHRVVIRICQPRLEVFETWEISVEELLTFAAEARIAAHKAWKPNAPRTPDSTGCQFCTVKATCPAFVALAERIADDAFAHLDGLQVKPETVSVRDVVLAPRAEPNHLSTEELAVVLRWRSTFESWFRSVHDELLARVSNGQTAPGWKVVEGHTKRAWRDEQTAADVLEVLGLGEDDIYDRKLISPKRAGDLLRVKKVGKPDKLIAQIAEKPPGKRALVSEFDSRPDIESAGDVFDIVDDLA